MTSSTPVHSASLADLDPRTLYRILRLRTDVFVVEQNCAYPELDGRDLEPAARQVWIERADGEVVATLRVLSDDDGAVRIGRVATAATARGEGLAAALMHHAIGSAGGREIVLDAQLYLHDWYARFGFVRDGADYVEDGIAHVPMRRRLQSEA
jgi:ElaA protein